MNSAVAVPLDGVVTRPVRPDDLAAFERLWGRLSEETIYRRFHAPIRRLSLKLRQHLVNVDHHDREALVAVIDGEVIAVARYDRWAEEPTAAEVAVLVEDAWQGRGLGVRMLRELAGLADRRGIHVITGEVQAENRRMVHIAKSLLGPAALRPGGPLVLVRGRPAGSRLAAPLEDLQSGADPDRVLRQRAREQFVGPGQPAYDGVAVGVEPLGGPGDAALLAEVRPHCVEDIGIRCDELAEGVGDELVGQHRV